MKKNMKPKSERDYEDNKNRHKRYKCVDDVIEDDNDNVAKVLNDIVWESLLTSTV